MLKTLNKLELPQPAPKRAAESSNMLKSVSKGSNEKRTDKVSDKKQNKDDFAAHLDNESDKIEADLKVSEVEADDLNPELLGDAPVKMELQANSDLKAKTIPMDAFAEDAALPIDAEPTPKLMDAKLIQQVNDVILPEGVESTKLEKAPMTMQDLLATPKENAGRAPAIDLAKSEVDPQLMNMEDFVAQKNAFAKKNMTTQAYGMPTKGMQMSAEAKASPDAKRLQEGLDAVLNQGIPTAAGLTAASLAVEGVGQAERADVGVGSQAKVFDLNSLKGQKLDADSIMTQISDYVIQARASKEPTITMKMNHQDLGMIDITVNRAGNNMVSIALGAQDQSVKTFLGQHRDSLMGHLSSAGVNVTDLKVELQSASRDNASNHQHAQSGQGQSQQFGSESNQRREEQQRREDLWAAAREKEVA